MQNITPSPWQQKIKSDFKMSNPVWNQYTKRKQGKTYGVPLDPAVLIAPVELLVSHMRQGELW